MSSSYCGKRKEKAFAREKAACTKAKRVEVCKPQDAHKYKAVKPVHLHKRNLGRAVAEQIATMNNAK